MRLACPRPDQSAAPPHAGQGDLCKSPDRGLRGKTGRSGQGVEAIDGEFVGCDIVAKFAAAYALCNQLLDEIMQVLPRFNEVLVSMQESHQFAVVVPARLVGNQRVRLQNAFESLAGNARTISNAGQLRKVLLDLTLVPGAQDEID